MKRLSESGVIKPFVVGWMLLSLIIFGLVVASQSHAIPPNNNNTVYVATWPTSTPINTPAAGTPTWTPTVPVATATPVPLYTTMGVTIALTPGTYSYYWSLPVLTDQTSIFCNACNVSGLGVSFATFPPGVPAASLAASSYGGLQLLTTNSLTDFFFSSIGSSARVETSGPTSYCGIFIQATATITPSVVLNFTQTYSQIR